MKVLFATTNPAKVKKYKNELEKRGIELITLNDLDFKLEVDENGKDAIENAYIKAKAYYDKLHIPTIGMDNNLYIEELPQEKQPGVFVRRLGGKELSDEEMIEHYSNLVREHGTKLTAKWVYGMVILKDEKVYKFTWQKDNFYFVDKPSNKRNIGYPLDSISIIPELNKYFVDLNEEEKRIYNEKDNLNDIIDFIVNSINDKK